MKKWYTGLDADKMLKNVEKRWTETGDYTNGRRGPCGELGWRKTFVKIDGTTYHLTYDRDGWPELNEV